MRHSAGRPHLVVVLALDTAIAFEIGLPHRFLRRGRARPRLARTAHGSGPALRRASRDARRRARRRPRPGMPSCRPTRTPMLAHADTIVVPGINGDIVETGVLPEALRRLAATARPSARWLSICTGAFVLAALGKLDGREATTHWCHVDAFRRHFPDVLLNPDVLYVDHGDVLTSAGNAAGIDLLLHVLRSRPRHRGRQPRRPGRGRRAVASRRSGPVHRPPRARRVRCRHRCDSGLGARAPRRADRPVRPGPSCGHERAHLHPALPRGDRRDGGHLARRALASTGPATCSRRATCPSTVWLPPPASAAARRCVSTSPAVGGPVTSRLSPHLPRRAGLTRPPGPHPARRAGRPRSGVGVGSSGSAEPGEDLHDDDLGDHRDRDRRARSRGPPWCRSRCGRWRRRGSPAGSGHPPACRRARCPPMRWIEASGEEQQHARLPS